MNWSDLDLDFSRDEKNHHLTANLTNLNLCQFWRFIKMNNLPLWRANGNGCLLRIVECCCLGIGRDCAQSNHDCLLLSSWTTSTLPDLHRKGTYLGLRYFSFITQFLSIIVRHLFISLHTLTVDVSAIHVLQNMIATHRTTIIIFSIIIIVVVGVCGAGERSLLKLTLVFRYCRIGIDATSKNVWAHHYYYYLHEVI